MLYHNNSNRLVNQLPWDPPGTITSPLISCPLSLLLFLLKVFGVNQSRCCCQLFCSIFSNSIIFTLFTLHSFSLLSQCLPRSSLRAGSPPPCSSSSIDFDFTASPPQWVWDEVRRAVAQEQRKTSSLPKPPPQPATRVRLTPARGSSLHRGVGRPTSDALNVVGSRLPRARPSHTGSQVKKDVAGHAVDEATLEKKCKSFHPIENNPTTCTDDHKAAGRQNRH